MSVNVEKVIYLFNSHLLFKPCVPYGREVFC